MVSNKFLFFFILTCCVFSQEIFREIKLNGSKKIIYNNNEFIVPNISNGVHIDEENVYLYYFERIPIEYSDFEVSIEDVKYSNLGSHYSSIQMPNYLDYECFLITEKKQHFLGVKIFPYIEKDNQNLILESFSINVQPKYNQSAKIKPAQTNNSVLSSGQWFKIAVEEDGIYSINTEFFNSLGINASDINPANIRIFGGHVGMLPEKNVTPRIDDLKELSLFFIGDDDDIFDSTEELLFYGQSPHVWEFQEDLNIFHHKQNIYSDRTYYFLTINQGPHKAAENTGVSLEDILETPVSQINDIYDFKERLFYENDLYNLVSTGQQWFGDYFGSTNQLLVNLDNGSFVFNDSIFFRARVAARSSIISKFEFTLSPSSNPFCVIDIPAETSDDYYYESVEQSFAFNPQLGLNSLPNNWDGILNINYQNNGNPSALAWLDFVELNFTKQIQYSLGNNQLNFRSFPTSEFQLELFHLPLDTELAFDVTDPFDMKKIDLYNSSLINNDNEHYVFAKDLQTLSDFVCLKSSNYKTPFFVEAVTNQNLHSYTQADFIIVTHNDFLTQANRLAEYHQNNDDMNVIVVTDKKIYNEFSAGSQDPVAIRDFVRMLYYKTTKESDLPKNILLFGDASFDYKNITSNNTNFIPTFQSYRSDNIKLSYCSDDFFGMLDDNEGSGNTLIYDLMDIGVGRIPVQTSSEAEQVIDKIINYSSQSSRGDWKNRISFVSDDVDDEWEINLMIHADALATKVDTSYKWVNLDKIYTDNYPQIATAGGERYPEAQEDLRQLINRGALIVNYIGHGGEVGWASERILELSDINDLENVNRLSVFVTATCEFSRFDDPARVSAGEQLLLNPNGGAVSLYSTSRTVNESSAYYIVDALYNYILEKNQNITMGEIMRLAKNDPSLGVTVNKRKFAFLGDPALKISYPRYRIETDEIFVLNNDKGDNIASDTINALSRVKVIGKTISDENLKKISLNGILNVTVYGKKNIQSTLNNNGLMESPFSFELQKDVIYKGKVNVINGDFEYEFIVPKDIPMEYGYGKLSYYVDDLELGDGTGYFEDFLVGGLNSNANLDNTGPEIQLFINDTTFVSGGFTDDSPDLLGVLYDNSGINTVGTGIGHDLVAILDGVTNNPYILNDYYESDLNTFKSGRVNFSFSELDEGSHTLSLKAWDVYNNSSSKQISFIVARSEDIVLEHLLNYPNPFSNFTRFSFEHNRPNEVIDVLIQVFTVSGKLVKTLTSEIINTGYRDNSIVWDGFDQFGDKLAKGVYIYRVVLKSKNDGSKVEKFEKLVILQ